MDLDKQNIDRLTKAFFSAFTNKGKQPELKVLYDICIAEAVIIKNTEGASEIYNLDSFIAPRKALLTNGTLTNFQEYEVSEETTICRNIAQRLSHYQKEGILNGEPFTGKGSKMLQFIKQGEDWKISSAIWDDE